MSHPWSKINWLRPAIGLPSQAQPSVMRNCHPILEGWKKYQTNERLEWLWRVMVKALCHSLMDSVFSSLVVHQKRCVLESLENSTNSGLWGSGSHYHFTGKTDTVPPLMVGLHVGYSAQSWQIVDQAPWVGTYMWILFAQMTLMSRNRTGPKYGGGRACLLSS